MNKQYFIDRLKEPSTWRGVTLILTAFGIALTPDQIQAISFFGLLISGAIGATTKDKK